MNRSGDCGLSTIGIDNREYVKIITIQKPLNLSISVLVSRNELNGDILDNLIGNVD